MSQENFRFRTPSPDKLSRDLSWSTLSLKSITNDSDLRKPNKPGFIVKYNKTSPLQTNKDLQDTVKRLSAQLTLEKKTVEVLEERLDSQSHLHSTEISKLRSELKSLQSTITDWKTRKTDQLRLELDSLSLQLTQCKSQVTALTSMFVDMLEPLVKPEDQEERENEERISLMTGIQNVLITKLEAIGKEINVDLNREIGKIKSWGGFDGENKTDLPRECPEMSIDSPADFSYVKDDLALPPISYSIEYFAAQSPVEAAIPSLQSTRKLDQVETFDATSEVYRLKQEILDRIQRKILESEGGSANSTVQMAEVMYDFEPQRVMTI